MKEPMFLILLVVACLVAYAIFFTPIPSSLVVAIDKHLRFMGPSTVYSPFTDLFGSNCLGKHKEMQARMEDDVLWSMIGAFEGQKNFEGGNIAGLNRHCYLLDGGNCTVEVDGRVFPLTPESGVCFNSSLGYTIRCSKKSVILFVDRVYGNRMYELFSFFEKRRMTSEEMAPIGYKQCHRCAK